MAPLIFLSVAMSDRSTDSGQFNVNLQGIKVLWWLLASIAYYAVAELATKTSPGKALMGLCVRDDLAQPATKRQILIRSAMRIVDILPVMYLLGLVTALASDRRKRIGDMVANTLVLQRSEVGEPNPGGKTLAVLAAVVLLTVGAGVALLATTDTSEKVGNFDVEEEAVPYAEEIIQDAFRPVSADAIRSYLAPGIVSDEDLETFIGTMLDLTGELTDNYEIIEHQLAEYPIPTGKTVESVDFVVRAAFEKRSGYLIMTISDVDGELKLVGFRFNA